MRRILRPPTTFLAAGFAGAAALLSPPADAASILTNGSFETGLQGWTVTAPVVWTPDGLGGPGAARLAGDPGIVGAVALSQCVAVEPGTDYDVAASVFLPYAPGAEGGVSIRVMWRGEPGCSGEPVGMAPSLDFPPADPDSWTRRRLERLRAPGDAASASLMVVPYSSGAPVAFSASLDEVELAPSPAWATRTIPTAASVDGARGERFRTTLAVTNPALGTRRIDATLRCRVDEACLTSSVSLLFAPGETRVFADALLDLFGRRNGAGAIELTYDARLGPLLVSARASTVHEARPGNGMAIPVLPAGAAVTAASFSGLSDGRAGDGGTRVNAGVYNPLDAWVWVGFRVHAESGEERNTAYLLVAPRSWSQVNDLFAATGTGPVRPGSRVSFTSEGPVFPFLISIDNRSGDPTFHEPREGFQP